MQKVLIANPNVEQRIRLCQQLANDKRLEVIETADGKTGGAAGGLSAIEDRRLSWNLN